MATEVLATTETVRRQDGTNVDVHQEKARNVTKMRRKTNIGANRKATMMMVMMMMMMMMMETAHQEMTMTTIPTMSKQRNEQQPSTFLKALT